MPSKAVKARIDGAVGNALTVLQKQRYATLVVLPASRTRNLKGSNALLTTYRDNLPDGQLRVVVQGVAPGLGGIYHYIRAGGFTITPDGAVVMLSPEQAPAALLGGPSTSPSDRRRAATSSVLVEAKV